MILLVTVTVLLLLPLTSTLDASYEGRKIIMQTDVDTIIVHTKLEPVRKQLNDLILEINIIRGTIIKESSNRVRASNEEEQFHKLIIVTLNSITEMAIHELNALDALFAEGKIRLKRALVILGDFLSAFREFLQLRTIFLKVTWVNHKIKFPAPRAHTLALRLACPMSKPGLVTPSRAQAQGSSLLSDQ